MTNIAGILSRVYPLALLAGVFTLVPFEITSAQESTTDNLLEEITVSAQKRDESIQDVPVSISAFNDDLLKTFGIENGRALSRFVPNLTITSQYNSSQPYIFIRGIGSRSFAASDTGAVGVYTDEIFISALSGQTLRLLDLERVEVLRGPQGTLFGKNTTGGAISFVSKKPTGKRELIGHLSYGDFNQIEFEAAAETPIVEDKVSARLAVGVHERDGYLRNTYLNRDENDVSNAEARLLVSITPNDNVDILLRAHYFENDSGPTYYQQEGLFGGADAFGYVESPDPFEGAYDRVDAKDDLKAYGFSAQVDWGLSDSTLTSITAYETHDREYFEEVDSAPINYINDNFINDTYQFTQEFRLASDNDAPLEWLLGAFYFYEDIDAQIQNELFQVLADYGVPFNPADLFSGPFAALTDYSQSTSSISGFGHVIYHFDPQWAVNAGIRYTDERKDVDNLSIQYAPSFSNLEGIVDGGSMTGHYSKGEFSGHAALEYTPTDDALIYAKFSRGFRSGGFNGGVFFSIDEFDEVDPEFVNTYEIGAKTSWLDQRLFVNTSVFYNDFTDMQIITVQETPGGGIRTALENAGESHGAGLELEVIAQPFEDLFTRFGFAYLDAEFDEYVNSNGVDLSGNRPPNSPEFTFSALVQYEISFDSGWKLRPQISTNYTSDIAYEVDDSVGQDAYWLFDARLALVEPNGKYEVAFLVRNVFDELYYTDAFDLGLFGFNGYAVGEPRTWMLTLEKFY
jgi:iron complex outermembrane recepter protein